MGLGLESYFINTKYFMERILFLYNSIKYNRNQKRDLKAKYNISSTLINTNVSKHLIILLENQSSLHLFDPEKGKKDQCAASVFFSSLLIIIIHSVYIVLFKAGSIVHSHYKLRL